jgi:hypothetical protein
MGETGYSRIISVRNSERVIPLGEFGQNRKNNIKMNV